MSFFDDASLAFLPSGAAGKDGKAYSIKPTDGTGDFTFSRGSNLAATRVGADGLIEKGRENLLLQSNNFDTTWATSTSASVTGGQSGYNGSSDAWLLSKTAANQYVQQQLSFGGVNTFSVYIKAGTSTWVALMRGDGQKAFFDLNASGALGSVTSGITSKIESAGNGWFRCSFVFENSTTNYARIYPAEGNGDTSGTSGSVYIQDAQLEIGLAATDYIETGATTGKAGLLEDEPRFDYSGGATCPSLLLEPSRTNLVQSEYYNPTNTEWRSEGNNGVTITTNDTTSPEGLSNASKLQGGGASNDRLQYNFNTSNTKAIYSVFVKGTGDVVRFSIFNSRSGDRINYDVDANGNFTLNQVTGITNHDIEDYGNGWYRIWGEFTTDAALTNYFQIYSDINGSGAIYLYGVQLEDNATYPTSYIPNHSGGSVTRGADSCVDAGDASTFNDSEGVLYAEIAALADDLNIEGISISDGTTSNRVVIFKWSSSNVIRVRVTSNGVNVVNQTINVSDVTDYNKIAISYKLNDFKVYINGTNVFNKTSGATPINLDTFSFATDGTNTALFFGNAKQVLYFPEALSDADCITLTT